jgi:hypothetical protein
MIALTFLVTSSASHPELERSSTIAVTMLLTPVVYAFVAILAYFGTLALVSRLIRKICVK